MAKGRICRVCGQENSRNDLDRNLSICVHCGNYMRFHAIKRINSIVDTKSFKRWCINENSNKNSDYIDSVYEQTLNDTRAKYGINEAIVIGEAKISGVQIAIGVMDTRFLMASMGHYVGECVTVLFERAKRKITINFILRIWRSENARRNNIFDANGKNRRCSKTL